MPSECHPSEFIGSRQRRAVMPVGSIAKEAGRVRGIIDRVRFRRLVYRGDLVAGWADALQLLLDLGEDLLPGTHHEIPRVSLRNSAVKPASGVTLMAVSPSSSASLLCRRRRRDS